jgi:hypothetical protein
MRLRNTDVKLSSLNTLMDERVLIFGGLIWWSQTDLSYKSLNYVKLKRVKVQICVFDQLIIYVVHGMTVIQYNCFFLRE